MCNYSLDQLVTIEQVRQLLESHHRISGMACGLMDNDEAIIVAAGLQEICTRFHWDNPESFAGCWRGDPDIKADLHSFTGDMYECRCQNGMVNIAMPVIVDGRRLATFFIGQFFYDDTPPDREYFIAQVEELGFDRYVYLETLDRVPVFSREHVRDNLRFLHQLVQLLAETGHANLERLRHLDGQRRMEHELLLLNRAVDVSSEAVFLMNGQGRFIYVNDTACRSLGYNRDEFLTMTPLDIDPDITPEEFGKLLDGLFAVGPTRGYIESRHRARDGRMFSVELSATVIDFDDNRFGLIMARDITDRKRTERRLQESEIRLRLALETTGIGIWDWDVKNDRWYASPIYYTMLGYEPGIGRGDRSEWLERVHPDDRAYVSEKIQSVLLHDLNEYQYEARIRHCDGTYRWLQVMGFGIERDHNGNVSRMLGIRMDITARKEMEEALRESERHFRTLAENSPDSILRYNTGCCCIYANPHIEKILGVPAGGMTGKTPMELFPAGEYREYQNRIEAVLRTGAGAEIEVVAPDIGEGIQYHHVRFTAERGEHGEVIGVLVIGRDITEQKRAGENLCRLNEELEDRVRERTDELEQANVRLQELDRMKSMFIASMSHELRTPLNSAIGFSRILFNEWAGPLSGEQKENLATILKSCKHLLSLINDVIDVSKIEAGMIDAFPEEFDIFDVVAEAVTSCENAVLDKGVDLTVQAIHHTMYTDRTRLLQCLLNLANNAVKYTEKGAIAITAEIKDDGAMLELSVADTGIGIKDEDITKLFFPFVRLDSPLAATVPGTGLGLYLTRKLVVEVLRGGITVSSAPGVGSTFVLRVPVSVR